jgi:hypothetical protein
LLIRLPPLSAITTSRLLVWPKTVCTPSRWGWARLTGSYTFRSREFSAQPQAAQYGSISLSVRF